MKKKIKQFVRFGIELPQTLGSLNIPIYNSEETISHLITKKKSLIRLGDGETIIIKGGGIHYQEENPKLAAELREIIEQYNSLSSSSDFILSVPRPFLNRSVIGLGSIRMIKIWTQARYQFKKLLSHEVIYGDAFCFSSQQDFNYLNLFESFENIIMIHNDTSYCRSLESKLNRSLHFIEIPQKNAYSFIDKIEESIYQKIREDDLNINDTCIIVSAGPAAKVLVFRLSKRGCIAFDMGHFIDSPLNDPTVKKV